MSNLAPELHHLDPVELKELITAYHSNDISVKKLLEKYKVDVQVGKFASLLPSIPQDDLLCPYCNVPLHKKISSRSVYLRTGKGLSQATCILCGHLEFPSGYAHLCRCEGCLERERQSRMSVEEQQREFVKSCVLPENFPEDFNIDELSLREAILLLALHRQSLSEEIGLFSCLDNASIPLAPECMQRELLQELERRDIICISPDSPLAAFNFKEMSEGKLYYSFKEVNYVALLGREPDVVAANMLKIESAFREEKWPKRWVEEKEDTVGALWAQITVGESLEELTRKGAERSFDFPVGEKTRALFEVLAREFSTSTIYSFIYSAAKGASDYFMAKGVPKQQAANSVVGNIQRMADRVSVGEWTRFSYNRASWYKDSALFLVLFYQVLKIGELGFTQSYREWKKSTNI